MNLNTLAKRVADLEGKKFSLSIAQIKEVISCIVQIAVDDENFEALKAMHAQAIKLQAAKVRREKLMGRRANAAKKRQFKKSNKRKY